MEGVCQDPRRGRRKRLEMPVESIRSDPAASLSLVNGFKWAPTFCVTSCMLPQARPCNPTPRASGFTRRCWLVLGHVSNMCLDQVPASGTVKHLTISKTYLGTRRPLHHTHMCFSLPFFRFHTQIRPACCFITLIGL